MICYKSIMKNVTDVALFLGVFQLNKGMSYWN